MSDLFELVQADFAGLITSLDDLPCHFVGQFALLASAPQLTTVDVPRIKLSRTRNPLAGHVSCGVFPHAVEACSVGAQGGIREAGSLSKLPSGDQSGTSGSLGIGSVRRASQSNEILTREVAILHFHVPIRFVHKLHSNVLHLIFRVY